MSDFIKSLSDTFFGLSHGGVKGAPLARLAAAYTALGKPPGCSKQANCVRVDVSVRIVELK